MKTKKSAQLASPTSIVPQLAEMISKLAPGKSFSNWANIPEIQQAYEQLATEFVKNIHKLPKPTGKGRGIVIPGGGSKYFPSMWVGINRIRHVGCKLPIEIWYLGEAEMDLAMQRILAPFNVTFRDALELRKKNPMRILNGWELKPYAIANSAFDEVMFIDADCSPTRNPEYLFDMEPYQKTGCIFWPDYPHWMLQREPYDVFGAPLPRNMKSPGDDFQMFGLPVDQNAGWDLPVESGQMLINKLKCWEPLNLATFFCSHSDYYFRFVHGDKECFHLAWRRLGRNYGMPMTWPNWDLHTALQYDFKGEIIFVHRNNDKWKLSGNVLGSGRIPFERECLTLVNELGKLWSGRVWENVMPTEEEAADMAALTNKMFFYHRVKHDARLIEFLPKNVIGKGAAEHEGSWSIFRVNGKQRLALVGKTGPTAFLTPAKDGIWEGRWLTNEQMLVQLIPVEPSESL